MGKMTTRVLGVDSASGGMVPRNQEESPQLQNTSEAPLLKADTKLERRQQNDDFEPFR